MLTIATLAIFNRNAKNNKLTTSLKNLYWTTMKPWNWTFLSCLVLCATSNHQVKLIEIVKLKQFRYCWTMSNSCWRLSDSKIFVLIAICTHSYFCRIQRWPARKRIKLETVSLLTNQCHLKIRWYTLYLAYRNFGILWVWIPLFILFLIVMALTGHTISWFQIEAM